MYNVSEIYKEDIKNTLRNPSYIKINGIFVDPDIYDSYSAIESEYIDGSNFRDATLRIEKNKSYATFERNFFLLDETSSIIPPSLPYYNTQGFFSSQVSDINREFATEIKLTIDFDTYRGNFFFSFPELTFTFDKFQTQFPSQIRIIAYNDVTEVYNELHNPNTNYNFGTGTPIPTCNKIEVIAITTGFPYARFRIQDFILGTVKIFTEETIQTSIWKKDVDLISAKLPNITFDFTFLDIDDEYNPENPTGLYPYMEKKQLVTFEYGYELDNENIEWITAGNNFTTGDITFESEGALSKVTFKTNSKLSFLNNEFKDIIANSASTITLYDLAESLVENSQDIILDSSLNLISTNVAFPEKTDNRSLLQLVANCGRCILDVNKDGIITMLSKDDSPVDFKYELSDMYNIPKLKKYPELQGVDTYWNEVKLTEEDVLLRQIYVDPTTTDIQPYIYTHDYAYNTYVTLFGDLEFIDSPINYAGYSIIAVATLGGFIRIYGDKYEIIKHPISVEFNDYGERCPVENQLLSNETDAINYATWIGNNINRRNEYTIENRGFPELDNGDRIKIDTLYSTDLDVDVISKEITFDGALSGKTKVLGV